MPLVRIDLLKGKSADYRATVSRVIHAAMVETINVPKNDRFQLISAYTPGMMLIDPTFPDVRRTPEASIVEILFLEGRTVEQKRDLFRRIAERAMQAGFAGDDIMVTLTENAPTDWSVGYGRCYGDQHAPQAIDA